MIFSLRLSRFFRGFFCLRYTVRQPTEDKNMTWRGLGARYLLGDKDRKRW